MVVVAGATSAAGTAVVRALTAAGARVTALSSNPQRLDDLAQRVPGIATYACDLADASAVTRAAATIRDEVGPADGLLHLVGGWRGGGGLTAQSDEDWRWLNERLVGTLRNTTRSWFNDLVDSDAGRLAIVSATAAAAPTVGNANYAAAKAAAEAWVLAVADGFRRAEAAGAQSPSLRAAAVVLVVKALVDDAMRADRPGHAFPGYTDVADLGKRLVGLWDLDASELNGRRISA